MKKSKLIISRAIAMAIAAAMILTLPVKGSVAYAENDDKTLTAISSEETENKIEDTDKEETNKEETDKEETDKEETDKDEADENQESSEADQEEEVLSDYDRAIKEAADARHALQNDPTHVHHYRWIAKMNESESAEGTINYMCEECDRIWYFRPYPAYHCFQGDIARQIEVAPENFTVKVKTSLFYSFDKRVMQALEKRPDVSLYVSFLRNEYIGDRLSFVIPAGEDTMSLLDENGYAGFIYLGNKYGMTLEEKHEIEDDAKTEETEAAETTEAEETTETEKAEEATEAKTESEEETGATKEAETNSTDKQI